MENKTGPNWDLSLLYRSTDDPDTDATLDKANVLAEAFAGHWRGRIVTTSAAELSQAIADDEEVQRVGLEPWRHYLHQLRKGAPYSLSEKVEQALIRKDLSGKQGFVQLFDELTSSFSYRFTRPTEKSPSELNGEELLSYLYHQDDTVRDEAFSVFLNKHREHALVLTNCFNNLLLDHEREGDLRGYPELMTPTHLSCETEPLMVKQMMKVGEQNYPLARDYYRLKQQLRGLGKMKNTDLYAPLPGSDQRFSFSEAQKLVVDSIGEFSLPAILTAGRPLRRQISRTSQGGRERFSTDTTQTVRCRPE